MRKTEMTIQVIEELDVILHKFEHLGFKQISRYKLNDWYYSNLKTNAKSSYSSLLKNSFLVRQVIEDEETNYLVYKDKEVDGTGKVLSEEKTKVELSNLANALTIFDKANINCWCELKQTIYVFQKGKVQFAVQAVEGLGNFIEYEEDESMSEMSSQQKIDFMFSQVKHFDLKLGADLSCKKAYMKYINGKIK